MEELTRLESRAREAGVSEDEINRIFREIDNLQERIAELERLIANLNPEMQTELPYNCAPTPFHYHQSTSTSSTNGGDEKETRYGIHGIGCDNYQSITQTTGYIERTIWGCDGGSVQNGITVAVGCNLTLSQVVSDQPESYVSNNTLTLQIVSNDGQHTLILFSTDDVHSYSFGGDDSSFPAEEYIENGQATYVVVGTISIFVEHFIEFGEFPTVYMTVAFGEMSAMAKPVHYYALESGGDDAWATDKGFAFNMRGILRDGAIQTDNFLFAHSDNMRDMHLELRTDPITISGVGFYSDSGFKWENGGETQAHYGKMMAVYPLFAVPDNDGDNKNRAALEWDLYASAAVGKVHSSYYEDSRLFGFAAGSFVRHLFGETDEWHLRFRRPLSATEIRPLVFGADMRVGSEESHWRFGLERDLDSGDLDATANWRAEF